MALHFIQKVPPPWFWYLRKVFLASSARRITLSGMHKLWRRKIQLWLLLDNPFSTLLSLFTLSVIVRKAWGENAFQHAIAIFPNCRERKRRKRHAKRFAKFSHFSSCHTRFPRFRITTSSRARWYSSAVKSASHLNLCHVWRAPQFPVNTRPFPV